MARTLLGIVLLLGMVSMCAAAYPPDKEARCPSRGVLAPESATTLFATASQVAQAEIDLSAFEYQGCTSEFDFEYAWMITKRDRQPDGSDAWKDLACATNLNETHTWACRVEPQRTVHVEAEGAGRAFDIRIEKDLSGDMARQIISPAIAELFRSREIAVCRSKELQPVSREEMREKSRMRGVDGWLERKGGEYELVLSGYRLHISSEAARDPQLRIRCWDPPDVLMESAVSRRGANTPG